DPSHVVPQLHLGEGGDDGHKDQGHDQHLEQPDVAVANEIQPVDGSVDDAPRSIHPQEHPAEHEAEHEAREDTGTERDATALHPVETYEQQDKNQQVDSNLPRHPTTLPVLRISPDKPACCTVTHAVVFNISISVPKGFLDGGAGVDKTRRLS